MTKYYHPLQVASDPSCQFWLSIYIFYLAAFLPPLREEEAGLRILILSPHYLTQILRDTHGRTHIYWS